MRVFLIVLIASLMVFPAWAEQPRRFSVMDNLDDGWEALEFPGIDAHTRYQLVDDDGTQVIEARTNNSASGRIARLRIEPGDSLMLRWRWKVNNIFEQGDARRKDGDDYPARIYVAFEFEPEKAGFFERTKRKAIKTLFGEELPGRALNYIWANRLEKGRGIANPYTDQTWMIAVNSGTAQLGEWVTVTRDIVADYREAFGEEPPPIVGIGIMSDSDNTGESASARYGDITLETNTR